MNEIIEIAGWLAVLLGLVHSVLGERLIFRNLRESSIVPNRCLPPLRRRHLAIIWASWHIVTVFGVGLGVLMIVQKEQWSLSDTVVREVLSIMMYASGILVLYATKWRHPGWVILFIIGALLSVSKFSTS